MVIKVRQGPCLVIGLVHIFKILTHSCFFGGFFLMFSLPLNLKKIMLSLA
jgi:hypothetical protein